MKLKAEYDKCLKNCGSQTPHKSGICMPCRKLHKPPPGPKRSKERIYIEGV